MTAQRSFQGRLRRPPGALRIAVIGTRGLPATYGGVERHVEEICARLADRGHDVTVFCRSGYAQPALEFYRGIRLVHLRTVASKTLEAIAHSTYASCRSLRGDFDVVAYHAVGPGLTAPIPRYLARLPVVQTIHGLDGDRAKWGRSASAALGLGTWMSARVPHQTIVVSGALEEHYRSRYGRPTWNIPNGVDAVTAPPAGPVLRRLGLSPQEYVLFVGRLVPEKAPHRLVRAFRSAAPKGTKLVMVGGSSFTDRYVADLHALAGDDSRIILPGYVYGADLHELYAHAGLFVLPSDLEGLPLTLLEAASFGVPVLASNIAPHVQVLGADGPGRRLVPAGDEAALAAQLQRLLDPHQMRTERAGAAGLRSEVLGRYSWDEATLATENLYRMVAGLIPHRLPTSSATTRQAPQVIDLRDDTAPHAAHFPAEVDAVSS